MMHCVDAQLVFCLLLIVFSTVDSTETGAGGARGCVWRRRAGLHYERRCSTEIHGMLHQRDAASLSTGAELCSPDE